MKNQTKILSIALFFLVLTPLISASIGGGRSVPNPLGRSHSWFAETDNNISEGYNQVVSQMQNPTPQIGSNITAEQKEDMREYNNFIISNPQLNITFEDYKKEIESQQPQEIDNELVFYVLGGVILFIVFIWSMVRQEDVL